MKNWLKLSPFAIHFLKEVTNPLHRVIFLKKRSPPDSICGNILVAEISFFFHHHSPYLSHQVCQELDNRSSRNLSVFSAYSDDKTIRHSSDLDCNFAEPKKCKWKNVEDKWGLDSLDFYLFEKVDFTEFPALRVGPGPTRVHQGRTFSPLYRFFFNLR